MPELQNWARNVTYGARKIYRPSSSEEIQSIVCSSESAKALGSRHSFNLIADTPGDLISLEKLNRVLEVDRDRLRVVVEAGVTYGQLANHLYAEGLALENLASLPHISVAGAVATATHGSGVRNRNLSAAVDAIEFVDGEGNLVQLSRDADPETFCGVVVGLGALGIVTRLSLRCVPEYSVAQTVYENLALDVVKAHFLEIMSGGYSVSLFTDWRGENVRQVWVKSLGQDPQRPDVFGALPASGKVSPIPGGPPENCTDQGGVAGPWHERLPHFRMDFTPSSGEELQTEYFVPLDRAVEALTAVDALRDRIAPLLHITEIRCIAADDLWMSPCFGVDCAAIHFTWKKNWPEVSLVLPMIESALQDFGARPHWGKLSSMSPDKIRKGFPQIDRFEQLMKTYDPNGKFRNPFLDGIFR